MGVDRAVCAGIMFVYPNVQGSNRAADVGGGTCTWQAQLVIKHKSLADIVQFFLLQRLWERG